DEAGNATKEINGILNKEQIQVLNRPGGMGGFGGGRGGGGGGGFGGGRPGGGPGAGPGGGGPGGPGGRPGGGAGGPGGARPNFKFVDPAPYNPFNPDTNPMVKANPQMATRMKQRTSEFMGKLEAKAK